MKKSDVLIMPRREFIGSVSIFVLGGKLFGMSPFSSRLTFETQELREELTPEEIKLVEGSVMAKDLKDYFGKGYSCAESFFLVSLKFLEKPEDLIWTSSGFGGGMYHRDLCGFLTGGIMAIGLSAGMLKKERKEKKEHCKQKVKKYWEWWTSVAPLHCSEIRKEGTSLKVCHRLGQLSSAKVEELIKPAKND